MKLSEKTLELNICAQASQFVGRNQKLFWFGLTQKQEARAGFDTCIKLGGRLLLFQFKASNRVLKCKKRVFLASHNQLVSLRKQARGSQRSVFYAFPLVGNTFEFHKNPNLISQTWLLDVHYLTGIGPPTKADKTLRKNGCHNVYVNPRKAVFHSEPFNVETMPFQMMLQTGFPDAEGINGPVNERFEDIWEAAQPFSSGLRALVLW